MTCDEFERVLPELEGGHNPAQTEHLRSCPSCLELVADLYAISREARVLALEEEEPGPRIWNSIETALRQEGLIRQAPQPVVAPRAAATRPAWRLSWLVPAFSALALALAVLLYQTGGRQPQMAQQPTATPMVEVASQTIPAASADEQELVNLVATGTPTLREGFESDLRAVDNYIRDAEESARSHPDDEFAQQHLISAYEQKAMLFEMALNHPVQ
jgi:hypothetical protein